MPLLMIICGYFGEKFLFFNIPETFFFTFSLFSWLKKNSFWKFITQRQRRQQQIEPEKLFKSQINDTHYISFDKFCFSFIQIFSNWENFLEIWQELFKYRKKFAIWMYRTTIYRIIEYRMMIMICFFFWNINVNNMMILLQFCFFTLLYFFCGNIYQKTFFSFRAILSIQKNLIVNVTYKHHQSHHNHMMLIIVIDFNNKIHSKIKFDK